MLSRIVKVTAILLGLAVIAAGVEAYRLYTGIDSIVNQKVNRLPVCKKGYTLAAATVTATPTTTAGSAPGGHAKKRPPRCEIDPPVKLPTLGGKNRINILLLGSDNDKKGIALLSQTMMVITVDPVHKTVGMLSIPRDFWVPIPGVYGYHKIDAAMSYGIAGSSSSNFITRFRAGVSLAIATVEDNFHIPIDYYAWVGLQGFVKVVDTLGGVVIDAEHPIVDDTYPDDLTGGNPFAYTRVYIPAGPQYMNGFTALEYVRSRHADLVGDFGRGARQEQMLLGIRRKADSLGLTNLATIDSLVNEIGSFVRTDVGTSQVLPMYNFAKNLKLSQIHRVVLSPPLYSSIGTASDGESIVNPDWTTIMPVVHRMFAPPSSIHSHSTKRPKLPKTMSYSQALALLARVSGALPPHSPFKQAPPIPVRLFHGRLFFDRGGNIFSYNGRNTYQITHTSGVSDPSLTPNARTLVFARRWSPVVSDITLLDRRTGRRLQLTHDRTTDGNVSDNLWAYYPAISPDGRTVVYASDAYKLTNDPDGGIDLALYKYDRTTGVTTQMTFQGTNALSLGAGGDADVHFDPANPNQVIFTSYYYLPNESVGSRLMLLNLTTDNALPLTPFGWRVSEPAWQPNGNHVAYVQSQGEGTQLRIAYFHNGALHAHRSWQVDSGMISEPAYSPDGRHLAYFKLVGNDFQIWIADLKNGLPTGKKRQVITGSGLLASSPMVWTH